jgi:mannitol 2-dehydrogenase
MPVLNAETLHSLASNVSIPAYDRSAVTVGIVHFGVGGFHRAHHAAVIDTLLNSGEGMNWGICGVGVLPADLRMKQVMQAQDGLYTLVLKHADGTSTARVIGSIVEYLYAPDDPSAVIERLAAASTRIVSLTITQRGYNIDQVTGAFDLTQPDVAHDLADGATPRTVFGLVIEALRLRRERRIPPFTIMSCDDIQGNGEVARRAFTTFARAKEHALGDWIEAAVAFPNSMVDRITPATTHADRAELATRFGVDDAWPVVCEPFFHWVLEGDFPSGRPTYEDAGVQLVGDAMPYELMKLRLLDASHHGLAYFGYLSGYRYVHDAARDPLVARFLLRYMREEAVPTLLPLPGINLDAYVHRLLERFANPELHDTIARLSMHASDRIPTLLLPVIRNRLDAGASVQLSAAIVASWARFADGYDEDGNPIEVVDPVKERIMANAARQHDEPTAFIQDRMLFDDLADDQRFVDAYRWALDSLYEYGAQATLEALVRDRG